MPTLWQRDVLLSLLKREDGAKLFKLVNTALNVALQDSVHLMFVV